MTTAGVFGEVESALSVQPMTLITKKNSGENFDFCQVELILLAVSIL